MFFLVGASKVVGRLQSVGGFFGFGHLTQDPQRLVLNPSLGCLIQRGEDQEARARSDKDVGSSVEFQTRL